MTKLLHVRLRPAVLVPLGLFALALLLRVIGANWHGTHFDEDIGGPARLLSGDFYPRTFYYPPLLTYLVAIAYVPLYGWGGCSAGGTRRRASAPPISTSRCPST